MIQRNLLRYQRSNIASSIERYNARHGSTASRPDPVSNIRTVRFDLTPNSSLARIQLENRRLQATVITHEFWKETNTEYMSRLEALKHRYAPGAVPSGELSRFYKQRMIESRERQRAFLRWWYKENFGMLYLNIKCWIYERLLPKRKEPGFFG